MRELLNEIRSAFEFEISLAGPLVPTENPPRGREPEEVKSVNAMAQMHSVSPTLSKAGVAPSSSDESLFQPTDATATRFEALIPADSPLHGFSTLPEVEAWVAATVLIPLDEIRKNPVFGVGDPTADLMVIGEAPGADEDRQGEPFVGRAGQLLNKILAAIGFDRGDVYIANILKSRPPNNRDPLAAEVEAHIPILYKQIALIRPRVILCVGKTAGNSLLGKNASLRALRGTFHDFHGVPTMVTYHPAALLRNPQWKEATWVDVQKLRAHYDRLVGGSSNSTSG